MGSQISAPVKRLGNWDAGAPWLDNTVYQALTDGFVHAFKGTQDANVIGYTDAANPPTVVRQNSHHASQAVGISFAVKKGEYWKVTVTTGAVTIFWIPLK